MSVAFLTETTQLVQMSVAFLTETTLLALVVMEFLTQAGILITVEYVIPILQMMMYHVQDVLM